MAARVPSGRGFPSIAEIQANPIVSKKKTPPVVELALDLSSSCVGWAVGADKKLVRYGKLVFKSTAGIGEKLVSFDEYLTTLLQVYQPTRVLIEQPLSRRAKVTARHYELVGTVRTLWYQHSGQELLDSWIISPITIKNTMKVVAGNDHEQNKIIMVNKVNALYRLNLRYDEHSKLVSEDDIADAIAVLTTYWRKNGRAK